LFDKKETFFYSFREIDRKFQRNGESAPLACQFESCWREHKVMAAELTNDNFYIEKKNFKLLYPYNMASFAGKSSKVFHEIQPGTDVETDCGNGLTNRRSKAKNLCNKLTETKEILGYITAPKNGFPGVSICGRKMKMQLENSFQTGV
jgi:hypothetical protein